MRFYLDMHTAGVDRWLPLVYVPELGLPKQPTACSHCGRAGVPLKLCGGCKAASFCSEACARQAWPSHKAECLAQRAQQAAARTSDRISPDMSAQLGAVLRMQQASEEQAAAAPEETTCRKCGREGVSNRCSGCHLAAYCSRECQVAHWPTHRKACKLTQSAVKTLRT